MQKNKALEYALRLLAKKDYTEAEIRRKFEMRQIEKEEAEPALLFLKDKGFIDDVRYAMLYRKSHPGRGDIRIKFELIKKGVKDPVLSEIFAEQDNDVQVENAREVARAWLAKKSHCFEDKYKLKQNLIAKLSRQGFAYDLICQALEGLLD